MSPEAAAQVIAAILRVGMESKTGSVPIKGNYLKIHALKLAIEALEEVGRARRGVQDGVVVDQAVQERA